MTDRYTDQPFLRFVDAYVMKAIDRLDAATETYCAAMEPQLRQSFGLDGNWVQIVEKQMQLPADLPQRIRQIWTEGQARFEAANGQPADPAQFAMTFVDRNFGRS